MGDAVRFLRHPQVTIDAKVPVQEWGLSSVGRQRVEAIAGKQARTQ